MAHSLLERARAEQTPLLDGNTAVFVWQGTTAPRLLADFNGWGELDGGVMELVEDGLWAARAELPEDAYVEYAFAFGDERVVDPLNPRMITNGMGKMNHYFAMPGVQPPPFLARKNGAARGVVTAEVLDAEGVTAGGKRRVYFYQPPVEDPSPLLVVWDGQDYLKRARIHTIVDNLIAQGRIRPVALAMPEHGRQARLLEYGCADITLAFLHEVILPAARRRLNLVDFQAEPGSYGVMGASMGGLMALYTSMRLPSIFGKVLSQSGAFSFPGFDFVVWDLVRSSEPVNRKIWMDVGTMEWLLDANRRMKSLLEARGYAPRYREYQGGHNYTSWQRDLAEGLQYLFPPRQKN